MPQESRRNLRISCSLPVLLRFVSKTPEEGWGTIYDISLGGIKLETKNRLGVGESFFMSFIIGDNYNFENTKGRVVRVDEVDGFYTCGVEFDLSIDKTHLRDALFGILDVETGEK
jgi:c-di-GMP-binding flagellar brake protein YcgR